MKAMTDHIFQAVYLFPKAKDWFFITNWNVEADWEAPGQSAGQYRSVADLGSNSSFLEINIRSMRKLVTTWFDPMMTQLPGAES